MQKCLPETPARGVTVLFFPQRCWAEAAYDEIDILGTIAREEEACGFDCHVVRIVDHFMHRGPHGLRT